MEFVVFAGVGYVIWIGAMLYLIVRTGDRLDDDR